MAIAATTRSTREWAVLAGFVVAVAAAAVFGSQFMPGEWYRALAKPSWTPPNWVFGPVWSILYVMIAIAGWLAWRAGANTALGFWTAQLVLNALWSYIFFGQKAVGLALVEIAFLLASIVGFIVTAWPHARNAALLFLPYAAWVSFASALNAAIYLMNR